MLGPHQCQERITDSTDWHVMYETVMLGWKYTRIPEAIVVRLTLVKQKYIIGMSNTMTPCLKDNEVSSFFQSVVYQGYHYSCMLSNMVNTICPDDCCTYNIIIHPVYI